MYRINIGRIFFEMNFFLSIVLGFLLGSASCSKQSGEKEVSEHDADTTVNVSHPPTNEEAPVTGIRMKDVLGINGFEWDFLVNNEIDPVRTNLIRPFGGFRHYLDWERIESEAGEYAFSPTLSGNWDYDAIYEWCKNNDVEVLACLKTVPSWFLNAYYPADLHDAENVPAAYESDRSDPASYIQFAKLAFQFAARYGKNKSVSPSLVSVVSKPDWGPNQPKIGLGLINYIECNNEPDRWWKGPKAQQTPAEYAANLSAFYDGHKGSLGKDVGVKQADPSMKVVMGGLAKPDVDFVLKMIEWCKTHRGYREDGTVDVCFDIVNYHHYSNNQQSDWSAPGIRGEAPEMSDSPSYAAEFVKMVSEHLDRMPVWVTELGYDVNEESPQRALPIQDKSILVTQADWSIRSALMYARNGISHLHFYMLMDVDENSPVQYASSGFVTNEGRPRPVLNYVRQVRELMGEHTYIKTLSTNPFIDLYQLADQKIYVILSPTEKGVKHQLEINLSEENISQVKVHELQPHSNEMKTQTEHLVEGKLVVDVSETPIFIEL